MPSKSVSACLIPYPPPDLHIPIPFTPAVPQAFSPLYLTHPPLLLHFFKSFTAAKEQKYLYFHLHSYIYHHYMALDASLDLSFSLKQAYTIYFDFLPLLLILHSLYDTGKQYSGTQKVSGTATYAWLKSCPLFYSTNLYLLQQNVSACQECKHSPTDSF